MFKGGLMQNFSSDEIFSQMYQIIRVNGMQQVYP